MSLTQWGIMPDFIGIGPGRTATTWLHDTLAGRVCLPLNIKETHFFTRNYHLGPKWYARHFEHCDLTPVVEVCPCFAAPQAPARIAELLPRCKLICTPRDPVERAYSHYKMMCANGFARGSLQDEMRAGRPILEGGRYAAWLPRWFERFGRDNVLVMLYDDLRANPQAWIDRICDFMEIARIPLPKRPPSAQALNSYDRAPRSRILAQAARRIRVTMQDHQWNGAAETLSRWGVWSWCAGGGAPHPALTDEQDAAMRELYRPDIEALEELIGRDLSAWKTPRSRRRTGAETGAAPAAVARAQLAANDRG
jgi:Sulfotransferase domain